MCNQDHCLDFDDIAALYRLLPRSDITSGEAQRTRWSWRSHVPGGTEAKLTNGNLEDKPDAVIKYLVKSLTQQPILGKARLKPTRDLTVATYFPFA